jgi:hypothetical protein
MRGFYLIVTTLLLASLGLLQLATFPHLPVVAPPMSTVVGSFGADPSRR